MDFPAWLQPHREPGRTQSCCQYCPTTSLDHPEEEGSSIRTEQQTDYSKGASPIVYLELLSVLRKVRGQVVVD